jgi:alpha-beta hydrolase superfamily lysophospholipase
MDIEVTTIQGKDGVELHLRKWPSPEPRRTLLLVHGAFEHAGRFAHVAEFFAARGYEVYAYDQRGHGDSGGIRIDVDDFTRYVDDLERVLRTVQRADRPLVVYSQSMGSLIAVLYASSTRPQPSAYVLAAVALDAVAPAAQKVAARVLSRVAPGFRMTAPVKEEQLSRDPAVGRAYSADPLVDRRATVRWGARLLDAMEGAREGLERIDTPALVIHGTDDQLVPPAASAPLAAVPAVERKLFPGLRHELHNEPEKEEVLGFVASWLDQRLASS